MKNLFFIFFLFTVTCKAQNVIISSMMAPTIKDSAKFNLSSGSISGGTGWTNINGDPSTGIRSGTAGLNNTITFSTVATANWTTFGGGCAAANNGINSAGVFPAAVNFQTWYQGSHTIDNTKPQVRIGGLKDSKTYKIIINGCYNVQTAWTNYYYRSGNSGSSTAFSGNPLKNDDVTLALTQTGISPSGGIIDLFFLNDAGHGVNFSLLGAITINEE